MLLRRSIRDCRIWLLDMRDRQGYRAFNYASWRECCAAEFGEGTASLLRLLGVDLGDVTGSAGASQGLGVQRDSAGGEDARCVTSDDERRAIYREASAEGEHSSIAVRDTLMAFVECAGCASTSTEQTPAVTAADERETPTAPAPAIADTRQLGDRGDVAQELPHVGAHLEASAAADVDASPWVAAGI